MTCPRRVVPSTTFLLTCRCTRRRFMLVPRGVVPGLFGYCVALAAERHGILVHAVIVMSNHYRAVVTDRHGGSLMTLGREPVGRERVDRERVAREPVGFMGVMTGERGYAPEYFREPVGSNDSGLFDDAGLGAGWVGTRLGRDSVGHVHDPGSGLGWARSWPWVGTRLGQNSVGVGRRLGTFMTLGRDSVGVGTRLGSGAGWARS